MGAKVTVKVAQYISDDDEEDYSDEESDSEEEDKDPIVTFFNEALSDELTSMQGCSKKKAEAIIAIRPFQDWQDLVAKLENAKDLTFQLITSCKEVLRIRGVVNKLMKNCNRIASEMETIIADITSKTSLEEGDSERGYIDKQPSLLNENLSLKPYQLVGLNWLILMHEQRLNGILGDEMVSDYSAIASEGSTQ